MSLDNVSFTGEKSNEISDKIPWKALFSFCLCLSLGFTLCCDTSWSSCQSIYTFNLFFLSRKEMKWHKIPSFSLSSQKEKENMKKTGDSFFLWRETDFRDDNGSFLVLWKKGCLRIKRTSKTGWQLDDDDGGTTTSWMTRKSRTQRENQLTRDMNH